MGANHNSEEVQKRQKLSCLFAWLSLCFLLVLFVIQRQKHKKDSFKTEKTRLGNKFLLF